MPRHISNLHRLLYFGIVLIILAGAGCQSLWKGKTKTGLLPIETGRILILGFMPALLATEEPGITQSPISGATFMAEPVNQSVADLLTEKLYSRMADMKKFDLISRKHAKGVLFNTIASNQGMRDLEIFQKTGKALSADAVMTGYIYRWREKKGTVYSASNPSSVAFEIYLIRSSDKTILWKGRFDKTQKPLSENIFDMGTFLKGKGKWMTAGELAELGLDELLATSNPGRQD